MRGLSPRKAEWAPVAAALESGVMNGKEYDSAESLARAIITHAMESVLKREWHLKVVALHEHGEPVQVAYGLYPTEGAAQEDERGGEFRQMILKVTPVTEP